MTIPETNNAIKRLSPCYLNRLNLICVVNFTVMMLSHDNASLVKQLLVIAVGFVLGAILLLISEKQYRFANTEPSIVYHYSHSQKISPYKVFTSFMTFMVSVVALSFVLDSRQDFSLVISFVCTALWSLISILLTALSLSLVLKSLLKNKNKTQLNA